GRAVAPLDERWLVGRTVRRSVRARAPSARRAPARLPRGRLRGAARAVRDVQPRRTPSRVVRVARGALEAPTYLECDPMAAGVPLAYACLEAAALRAARLRGVPRVGMGAVADAFTTAAPRAGAEVVTAAPIGRVGARGVRLETRVRSGRSSGSSPPPARAAV